jgi:hypothetical protein
MRQGTESVANFGIFVNDMMAKSPYAKNFQRMGYKIDPHLN